MIMPWSSIASKKSVHVMQLNPGVYHRNEFWLYVKFVIRWSLHIDEIYNNSNSFLIIPTLE